MIIMPMLYHPPEATVYRIVYHGAGMDGLELVIHAASMDALLNLEAITFADGQFHLAAEEVRALYGRIMDHVKEWNLPIPATVDSLLAQEPSWVIRLLGGWMSAMGYVDELPTATVTEELLTELPMEAVTVDG